MDKAASIFFDMTACNPDAFAFNLDETMLTNWLVELANLIILRRVWIVVVLPMELGLVRNGTLNREAKHDGFLNRLYVNYGQGPR